MNKSISALLMGGALTALAAVGCGEPSGRISDSIGLRADTALPQRAGTVVIDGCVIDQWQRSTLASPAMKRVIQEVILLCLVPRLDETVGPQDESAKRAINAMLDDLHTEGYRVHLGVSFTDESGQRYDGQQTLSFLQSAQWRKQLRDTLQVHLAKVDGIEIDLQQIPSDAQPHVTALIAELAPQVRGTNPPKKLNIFVPPSVAIPSDLPGGDAFSYRGLAPNVDRMRIMTLDYSESAPGPTIDPGWAVDAIRLAKDASLVNVDVSFPLYGTDFGPRGRRAITYHEARAIALIAETPIERGPTGAPFIRYNAFGGEPHELWFDDAESTGRALGAWSYDVLPPEVGVLFYGLGAEDPALFERLASRLP